MRSLVQVAALVLAAASAPACARPYSVNDLLAAETFGQIGFTQDGSALIFERQVGFDEGGPFEYDAYPPLRRSRIYVADPRSSAPPRQLLSVDPGEGHTAGPLSPSGRAMVVLRLKGRDWEAGVVQLSSREVRWLGLIPELAQLGRTIAWRGDEQLVIAVRNDIPLRLRAGWQARETLQAFWSATAQGKGAISQVSGASAYAGDTHPNGRLVLVDVATGGVRTLAKGDFYDVEVSPDGTALAAMENLEPLPMDMLPRQVAAPNRRRNLLLVDLTSGARSSPCADCDLAPHLMAWSPNAQEVLVYGRRFGQGWSHADLLRLSSRGARSVATGGLKLSLGYTTEGHLIPRAGWLQGEPIALLQATNEGRADWYRLVFFDKGRSARAATLAAGGAWRSLEAGQMTPLQPLARIDDPAELAWAAEWVLDLVCGAGVEETPFRREAIWSALASLAQAPCSQRTLTVLCALLQDREAALAIEPFTLAGPWGALLDGAEQDHATSAFDTYELEALMAARAPLAPTLTAMFHALERSFDGAPVLLVLDEAWLFLDQARFAAKIREWLKTLRKKRVAVVFATQSLDDIAASSIAASLIESCPTQIFLPNPRALEPASAELYRAFGLSDRQLELIAFAPPKRAYYWRQPHGQRLFELRLTGAALAICGASTPEDQALIDALVARSPAGAFARDFLKAKGYDHVDQAFDALA